jgi:hypothetical protein
VYSFFALLGYPKGEIRRPGFDNERGDREKQDRARFVNDIGRSCSFYRIGIRAREAVFR